MRINAYIMLADPAWIESSLLSYYNHVQRIVVTYDEDSLSWSGTNIQCDSLIERVRNIDFKGKCEFVKGKFSRSEFFDNPMANDTYQRNFSINLASDGADWVLQLDTDEILPDFSLLTDLIHDAVAHNCESVWFPQRWMFQYPFTYYGLEWANRGGKRISVYAGPIAIRAGTEVILARRPSGIGLHVNRFDCLVAPHSDNYVVSPRQFLDNQCLLHMSHVRSYSHWRGKLASWSHSQDFDYTASIKFWRFSYKYPIVACLVSHLLRKKGFIMPLRLTRLSRVLVAMLKYNDRDGNKVQNVSMQQ